jgi:hypothetical protein
VPNRQAPPLRIVPKEQTLGNNVFSTLSRDKRDSPIPYEELHLSAYCSKTKSEFKTFWIHAHISRLWSADLFDAHHSKGDACIRPAIRCGLGHCVILAQYHRSCTWRHGRNVSMDPQPSLNVHQRTGYPAIYDIVNVSVNQQVELLDTNYRLPKETRSFLHLIRKMPGFEATCSSKPPALDDYRT